MKKLKCFVSVLLCLTLLLCTTSCQLIYEIRDTYFKPSVEPEKGAGTRVVPEGYTGGTNHLYCYHADFKVIWIDTTEELEEALLLTKSHGTEILPIYQTFFFDCEEYGFDVKFRVSFPRKPYDEEKGFDQKIPYIHIQPYIFMEYVEIEKLEYSYYYNYPVIEITRDGYFELPDSTDVISIEGPDASKGPYRTVYNVLYNGEPITYFDARTKGYQLTEEDLKIFEKTITFITTKLDTIHYSSLVQGEKMTTLVCN